jgi:hypothetical protein
LTIHFGSQAMDILAAEVVLLQAAEATAWITGVKSLDGRQWTGAGLKQEQPRSYQLCAGEVRDVEVAGPGEFMALMRDIHVKDRVTGRERTVPSLIVPNLFISSEQIQQGFAEVDTRIVMVVVVKALDADGTPLSGSLLWGQIGDTVMNMTASPDGEAAFLGRPGHYAMAIEGSGQKGHREFDILPSDRGIKEVVLRPI